MTRLTPLRRSELYGAAWCLSRALFHGQKCFTRMSPKATWIHGWVPPGPDALDRLLAQGAKRGRLNLVATRWQARTLQAEGFESLAIGMPFVYSASGQRPRIPRTVLLVPSHSARAVTTPCPSRWAAQVLNRSHFFDNRMISILLHEHDYRVEERRSACQRLGLTVIRGADSQDIHSLDRLNTTFSQFETVVGEGAGSYLPMAAYCGAKICVDPYSQPNFDNRAALKAASAPAISPLDPIVRELYPYLYQDPEFAVGAPAFADASLGTQCCVSRQSTPITRLFSNLDSLHSILYSTLGEIRFKFRLGLINHGSQSRSFL